jgi:uncharacterized protein
MSTGAPHAPARATNSATNGLANELNEWRGHTRVFLQPVAAPSILGLFGFAAATFITTAYLVGWYGTAKTPLIIFPFAMAAGGFAQGAAALWAYKARDGLATAIHGIWASFWIAFGILQILVATHALPTPAPHAAIPAVGYWFFALAAITLAGALASLAESLGLTAVMLPLAVGAALLGVFYLVGGKGWEYAGGYVTMASAFTAFYTATAMMMASTFGRVVLPLGKYRRSANVPGEQPTYPLQFEYGEPGVKQGQ